MNIKNNSKRKFTSLSFVWFGVDKNGKKATGVLEANSEDEVLSILQKQQISHIRIKQKTSVFSFKKGLRITGKDVTSFTKQFASLINANIGVVKALDLTLTSQKNIKLQEILWQIRNSVASGENLATSFAKYPHLFSSFYCGLLSVGVESGRLGEMLDYLVVYQAKQAQVSAKVKKAIFYPVFILIFGLGVAGFLLLKVVPKFESMFNNFGAKLPWITDKVLELSKFLQENILWLVIGIFALILLGKIVYDKSARVRFSLAVFVQKIPVVGKLLTYVLSAHVANLLAVCFKADIKIEKALHISQEAITNPLFVKKLGQISEQVASGQNFSFAMQNAKVFPQLFIQMLLTAEETGHIANMLQHISDFYNLEADNLIDKLTSLLEPVIMIILGAIVGILVVSIYLPIFTLNSAISG